ncbi:GTP cyclohydrolase [Flavobacterium salilacus subsp. salilacus]|uniref:GTP cyclohydrolase n=1 Tax=Flavobacterium TaxID=237 RepID=UPI001075275C|nr:MULTISPECIES: GTP cyclohydrolase [Flavobacterium]KAF2518651.1 GTP cyclohydrolase [Flavobacterium salilacus subsp. salilacus]MBE1613613.1 GTP cyclohydrolase [Flavobacterium sp. SaA2.13]
MITIKEAKTKKEIKDFIKFSFKLYKGCPYWVPPIIDDELENFDVTKNPAFAHADAKFYLAYRNNEIVGKVAVIINWQEVKMQQKSKVRFGWFDVIDDIEVTKALLEKVYEYGREHKMEYVEGPIGFSNLDKVGALTEGFDKIGTAITWYNYPYYIEHFEKLGFVKEKEYIESIFSFNNVSPTVFEKATDLVKRRYQLKALTFTTTAEVMPYVDKMFDLFNKSYEKLASFVAVSQVQKEYFKQKYIGLINPEYIKFVEDKDGNLVAFSIVMPSFAEALIKANGKLFPFGFLHLLRARKHSKDVVFYLIGVDPEYQNKGVTAIIFDEYYKVFTKNNIRNCIRTPELEDNFAMHNLWKHFNPIIHKRRRTYRKDL